MPYMYDKRLELRISEPMWRLIDEQRGDVARSVFVRNVLKVALDPSEMPQGGGSRKVHVEPPVTQQKVAEAIQKESAQDWAMERQRRMNQAKGF